MTTFYGSRGSHVAGNTNGYRLRLELYPLYAEASNNRTRIRADLYIEKGSDAYGDLASYGSMSVGDGSWPGPQGVHTSCNPGPTLLNTTDGWAYHDANGNGTGSASASFSTQDWWIVYLGKNRNIGVPSISVSGSITLDNFDRSPTTPTISSIVRSSNGSDVTTFNYSGGVNNSGPAVTYTLEYWTSATFPVDPAKPLSAPGNAPFSLPSPTTPYYFRVRAANSDGTKFSTVSGPYYGVPSAPTFASGQGAKTSSTVSGSIDLSWTAPTNTQTVSPAVPTYDVYRNGEKVNSSPITTTSYTDTGLVRGTSYDYTIVAVNGLGFNPTSSRSTVVSSRASGVPAQITGTVALSKVGRNVTVSCGQSPDNYGNIIIGYAVQYSTDEGETWSGGTAMVNRSHKYELLPPALTYVFRCYAINSIGNGDTLESAPVFVSAGGRRKLPGGDFEPTQTAKRYDSTKPDGQKWVDLNTAKRYSAALDQWVDLS